MERKTKNILMGVLVVIFLVLLGYTVYTTKNNNVSNGFAGGNPPNMMNNQNGMPQMPNDNEGTPPEKPSNDNQSNSENGIPNGTPPDMNNNSQIGGISTKYYVFIGIESLILCGIISYLIFSKFNKKNVKEVFKESKFSYFIVSILLTGCVFCGSYLILNNNGSINNEFKQSENSSSNISYNGSVVIDGTTETLNSTYETSESDTSSVLVKNGGIGTLENAKVNKTGGDSSNTENSEFYGVNAGVLVTDGTLTINNSEINTNAKGSNAVFATGENSKIYVNNTTIKTTGSSSSRGLDATYDGYIEADNVNIKTSGGSSATLATDRGEGTVKVSNSTLETNGQGSPVIYSTGDISIENTNGSANGSQMIVIEGKNSATVTNSTLNASAKGNRGDTDVSGVMIYQSMSGDANVGVGTLTVKDSTLEIQSNSSYYKTAPMFFITNTDAVVNLENTKLIYGSNILFSIKGTNEWGTSGSNGGEVTVNATNQSLIGDTNIDNISSIVLNLRNSSYEGSINKDNTASSVTLTLDDSSTLKLTSDTYITKLENSNSTNSNIDFNGYKLYVNGIKIN